MARTVRKVARAEAQTAASFVMDKMAVRGAKAVEAAKAGQAVSLSTIGRPSLAPNCPKGNRSTTSMRLIAGAAEQVGGVPAVVMEVMERNAFACLVALAAPLALQGTMAGMAMMETPV